MRRLLALASVAILVTSACGGGDKSTGPGTNTGGNLQHGTLTATVNGANWGSAVALSATYSGNILAVAGATLGSSLGFAAFVSGPGTFTTSAPGYANATYTQSGGGWSAAAGTAGGSVSITVTSISSTAAAGTFSFTLAPSSGTSATGTKTVTGSFSVKF